MGDLLAYWQSQMQNKCFSNEIDLIIRSAPTQVKLSFSCCEYFASLFKWLHRLYLDTMCTSSLRGQQHLDAKSGF